MRQHTRRPRLARIVIAPAIVLATATALNAHDFWLVPNAFRIGAGDTLTVLGQTSSRFPTTESAVVGDRVADARLIGATSESRISDLSVAGKSLRLRARPRVPGQYQVAARLHWRSMRESAASFRRYLELEGAPAALEQINREGLLAGRDSLTRRYAKYAKTLVQVGNGGGQAFGRVVGHPLEFIPQNNPAEVRPGDTLAFRLLFLGRPAGNARVHAGAVHWSSPTPQNTSAAVPDVELLSDTQGIIRVPISAAGMWNVRTIQIAQSPAGVGADWDAHWATLVFLVAPQGDRDEPNDSLDVVNAVNAYHHALRTGDSTAALTLLMDDAVILESGGAETREEYRSHHLPADITFARAVPSQRSPIGVKVRGDVAWAWSTSNTQGSFRGRDINSAGAELMVLTRTPAGWKINAIHWSSRTRRQ